MGCKNSVENNERELYNEDTNVRHRFLLGVHVSKDPDGVEGNIQLACGVTRKKKYERVEQTVNNTQALVEQTVDNSHDNG